MGLGITVGILADLLEHDPEGAEWVQSHLTEINQVLAASGIAPHKEPANCDVWSAEGIGYSGLHVLRGVAGLIWQGKPLPEDRLEGNEGHDDALFSAILPFVESPPKIGFLGRLLGQKVKVDAPQFSHLVCHSDAEGYYVPIDFRVPLIPKVMQPDTASIWPVGSVQQLNAELDILFGILGIPDDAHSESDVLHQAIEMAPADPQTPLWLAQPVASYTALILKEACTHSLQTGAAISFG